MNTQKRLKDYGPAVKEFFPAMIELAKPTTLNGELFVASMEANFKRFGQEMFLSASQLTWLVDLGTPTIEYDDETEMDAAETLIGDAAYG